MNSPRRCPRAPDVNNIVTQKTAQATRTARTCMKLCLNRDDSTGMAEKSRNTIYRWRIPVGNGSRVVTPDSSRDLVYRKQHCDRTDSGDAGVRGGEPDVNFLPPVDVLTTSASTPAAVSDAAVAIVFSWLNH